MSAELSKPTAPTADASRAKHLKLATAVTVLALVGLLLWRGAAAMLDGQAKSDALMSTALPTVQQFMDALRVQDYAQASAACAATLKPKLSAAEWKELLAAHPELKDPATALGFDYRSGFFLSFGGLFGLEPGLPNTLYEFRYRLSKPGRAEGPTPRLAVEYEEGRARITRISLGEATLAER